MCDPLSAAGAALSVIGMGANMIGANKVKDARDAVWRAENARQRDISNQSAAMFDKSLAGADRPTQDKAVSDAAAARTSEDTARLEAFPTLTATSGKAPAEIGAAFSRAMRGALNRNIDRAERTADVNAYGDANRDLNTSLVRSGQWQSIFGDRAVNSSRLIPGELEAANYAGQGWSTIGGLLGGAGRLAGIGGASGVGPSFGQIFGSPANDPTGYAGWFR